MEDKDGPIVNIPIHGLYYNERTKRIEFHYKRERNHGLYQDVYGYTNPDGSYSITIDNNIQDWELPYEH